MRLAGGVPLLIRRVRRWLRSTIAYGLYYTGVLGLLRHTRLRRRAVVLMYHRVLTTAERAETASHPAIVVSDATFAMQMAELKRRFRVLSIDEFAGHLASRQPFPDRACLVTFDDGWSDNATNAWPVLREHGLPAVIFLPVNFIGTDRMFWRETMTALLTAAVDRVRRQPAAREPLARVLETCGLASLLDISDDDPRTAISEALGTLKGMPPATIDVLVGELTIALGSSTRPLPAADGFMTWSDVSALQRSGIAFGGHGADHRLLDRVPPDEVQREVETSWSALLEHTGTAPLAFAYPNGNTSPAAAAALRQCGYRLAFTTEPGVVTSADDPFTLRRVNMHEDVTDSAPLFHARLVGLF